MRDLASIVDQMIATNAYHWRLAVKDNYTETPVAATTNEQDISPDRSMELLNKTVGYYREPETVYTIEILKVHNATGNARTGKINFVKNLDAYEQSRRTAGTLAPLSGPGNLSGVGGEAPLSGALLTQFGEIQQQARTLYEERLNAEKALSDMRAKLAQDQAELLIEKRFFEREKKDFEENRAVTIKELQEKERKFESRADQIREGVERGAEKFILGMLAGNPSAGSLAGFPSGPAKEEPKTPQEEIIESVAKNIFEHVTDITELKTWGLLSQKFIQDPDNFLFQEFRSKAVKMTA